MFAHPALVGPQAGPASNHTPEYSTTSAMAAKNIHLPGILLKVGTS